MGFTFRKSFNFGPLRLNLSKSGIGASVGAGGVRVGKSATGKTYASAMSHGVGYRGNLANETITREVVASKNEPIAETKQCTNCQAEQAVTARFCNNCGLAITEEIKVASVAEFNGQATTAHLASLDRIIFAIKVAAAISFVLLLGWLFTREVPIQTQASSVSYPTPSPTPAPFAYRDEAVTAYSNLVQNIYSNYNGIEVKLAKVKGGFALYAYHEFFNEYEFSAGDDAKLIQAWAGMHRADLDRFKIVRVGVMGRGAYSSGTWYDLK